MSLMSSIQTNETTRGGSFLHYIHWCPSLCLLPLKTRQISSNDTKHHYLGGTLQESFETSKSTDKKIPIHILNLGFAEYNSSLSVTR